jgi:ribosomal protein L40E
MASRQGYDKSRKSVGVQIACPVCSNRNGPFNPKFGVVTVFTCPQCSTDFDSSGRTGPFTKVCSSCGTEQPLDNDKCYMCGQELAEHQAGPENPERVMCGNCHESNPKGAGSCRRCGQHINGTGAVIRVG